MGVAEYIAVASLTATVGSSYEQYRQAKKMEKSEEKAQQVQAGITATENRRQSLRQAAKARILQQRAVAQREALGGSSSDSGTQGTLSGLTSTAGAAFGREGSARVQGNQLSAISSDIASARTQSAMAGAVGGLAGSVFSVTGGSLFDDKGTFQWGQ